MSVSSEFSHPRGNGPRVKSPIQVMLGMLEAAFGYFASGNDLSRAHGCSVDSEGGKVTSNANGARLHHQRADISTSAASNHVQGNSTTERRKPETAESTSGVVAHLLALDEHITTSLGLYFAHPSTPLQRTVRACCKILEYSGHGVPWFTFCFILLALHYFTNYNPLLHYGLNMLLVLVVDILVVAPVKLVFKRPRPYLNAGAIPLSVSQIDQYAFPSGHASRCVALAAYFCYMPPFNPWTHLWYIWGMLVSLSRIILGRHHVLDVLAGMLAGLFIFEIVRQSGFLLGTL